ncbi:MAG TPA: tetratricopeptide repeat protein [Thermodesulfobacteriota bacterium]
MPFPRFGGGRAIATLALACAVLSASVPLAGAGEPPAAPGPASPAPDADALKAEAARLVRQGDIASARERYRRALRIAPGDVEALFGYARTSAWLGEYGEAERAYREGLARAPRPSVEGLLGLADVLAWQGRYDAALARVAEAEAVAPDDPEVWRRRGRFNQWRGKRDEARAAYTRTLTLVPGDPEATRALAEIAAMTSSTLDLEYRREELSSAKAGRLGTSDTNTATLGYSYRGFERLTLGGRVTYSDKFGDSEVDADDLQIGAEAAWRFLPRTTLRVDLALGPDADVLPAFEGEIELLQGLSLGRAGSAVLGAGYRYLDFNRNVRLADDGTVAGVDPRTRVHIVTPSIAWYAPWPVVLLVRYYYSASDFESIPPIGAFPGLAGGTDDTSSILVRTTFFPEARLSPFFAYARGVESFATAAQLRGLTTDTYAGGATLRLGPHFGLRLAVEYQDSGRDTAGGAVNQTNVIVGTFVSW